MSGAIKVLKTAANSVDNFSGAFKSLKSLDKLSGSSSLLKNLNFKSISGTFSTAASTTKRTSSLANTSTFVKKFSSIIPSSTDDILTSVGDSVKSVGDDIISISRIDADPKFVKSIADTNSLSRLKKVSVSISSSVPQVSTLSRRSTKLLSNSDNLKIISKNIPPINKVDDIGTALKNGKGVTQKLDTVSDAGKLTTKNIDKASGSSKTLKKLNKGVDFIKKHAGTVNIAILGFFFLGQAFSMLSSKGKEDGEQEEDPLVLVTDPSSDVYKVEEFSSSIITDGETTVSIKDTLFQKEIIIAFLVASSILIAL